MNTPGYNPKFNFTSARPAVENPTNFLFCVDGANGKWWCSKGWSRRWQPQRGTASVPRTPPYQHLCCITIIHFTHIGSGYVGITIDDKILHRLQVVAPAATPDAATRRQPRGRQTSKHSDPIRFWDWFKIKTHYTNITRRLLLMWNCGFSSGSVASLA